MRTMSKTLRDDIPHLSACRMVSLFITKLTECQDMNYVMLRSVNLPPTVTNKKIRLLSD